jgi:hypothetical protein
VLVNLPEYLKPVIQTAYITGWRIKSEILTRQKQHLDLQSGFLRLERGETNSREERKFPLTPGMRELLVRQLQELNDLERKTNRIIPWLFHHNGKPIKDFRKAWALACGRSGVVGKGAPRFSAYCSSQSRTGGHPAFGCYGDGWAPHGIDLSVLQGHRRNDAQGECSKACGAPRIREECSWLRAEMRRTHAIADHTMHSQASQISSHPRPRWSSALLFVSGAMTLVVGV